MSYEEFLELCKKRRSVRKYNDKKISMDDVKKIIEAGIQAPSGTNLQGWKFKILDNSVDINLVSNTIEEKVKKLASNIEEEIISDNFVRYAKNFSFFKNAPMIILLYSIKPRQIVKRFFGNGLALHKGEGVFLSLGMVMQNMMLAAETLGISTCALTGPLIAEKEIIKEFIPPAKYQLSALLSFGYSDLKPKSPGRKALDKFIV